MVEHKLGLSGNCDLIDKLAATRSSDTGSMPRVSSRSAAEPCADDRRRAQGALGRRVKAVDARGDGRLQRGRHADLASLDRRNVGAAACRAAHPARPVRAPSPRQRTDYRRPSRRSSGPARKPRGPDRAAARQVPWFLNHSAAQGQRCGHRPPRSTRRDIRGDR